jgi:hypothetical protein
LWAVSACTACKNTTVFRGGSWTIKHELLVLIAASCVIEVIGLELAVMGRNLLHDRHPECGALASRSEYERNVFGQVRWQS